MLTMFAFVLLVSKPRRPRVQGECSDFENTVTTCSPTHLSMICRSFSRFMARDLAASRRRASWKTISLARPQHIPSQRSLRRAIYPNVSRYHLVSIVTARRDLKRRLCCVTVEEANQYWLRDLWRRHAQGLAERGARLRTNLQAG